MAAMDMRINAVSGFLVAAAAVVVAVVVVVVVVAVAAAMAKSDARWVVH